MAQRDKKEKVKNSERHLRIGEVVDKQWEVVHMLGKGMFSTVYEVRKKPNERGKSGSKSPGSKPGGGSAVQSYAMKVETASLPEKNRLLRMDVNILRRVRVKQSNHFVQLCCVGSTDRLHYMVTTLVGSDLHKVKCPPPPPTCQLLTDIITAIKEIGGFMPQMEPRKGKFRFRTVAHIALRSLEALRELHDIGYLHRDVKPANFAIGLPPNYRELYLLDFGLCRQYRHENGRLRRPRDRVGFRGTLPYAPLAAHKSAETSRADDLWSWLYSLIEMTTGPLPWADEIRNTRKLQMAKVIKRVGAIKAQFNGSPTELMHGCPMEFMTLYENISALDYQSDPNYDAMLSALKQLEDRRRKANSDGEMLDWEIK